MNGRPDDEQMSGQIRVRRQPYIFNQSQNQAMESSSVLNHDEFIREQILRAIALNRIPGYHFCGNFFDLWFEDVYDGKARVTIQAAPHVMGDDGNMAPTPLAVAADFAAATAIRTAGDPSVRLATVSLHMQLTNAPIRDDLIAYGTLDGFFEGAKGRLGLARFHIESNGQLVAFGTSTFMVMPPPGGRKLDPIPWINKRPEKIALPALHELDESEKEIFARGERALAAARTKGTAFLTEFLNITTHPGDRSARAQMDNGPHVGNRVGHVQGGISMGMVIDSANASLPAEWALVGITASYVSPGEGDELTAHSEIIHRGRLTAVVHTRLLGIEGRLVLEVTTNHTRRQDGSTPEIRGEVGTV